MSLKDEIDRTISEEVAKLEDQDISNMAYQERQCLRFQQMRVLLQEIVSSVDSTYLETSIKDWSASIKLGDKKRGSYAYPDIQWHIEPNKEHVLLGEGAPFTKDKQGILVEQKTNHFYLPEPEIEENTHIFTTETEVAEFLIAIIAKQIAKYQHTEKLRAEKAIRK